MNQLSKYTEKIRPKPSKGDRWLTLEEAGHIAGETKLNIYNWVRTYHLQKQKVGKKGTCFVSEKDLKRVLAERPAKDDPHRKMKMTLAARERRAKGLKEERENFSLSKLAREFDQRPQIVPAYFSIDCHDAEEFWERFNKLCGELTDARDLVLIAVAGDGIISMSYGVEVMLDKVHVRNTVNFPETISIREIDQLRVAIESLNDEPLTVYFSCRFIRRDLGILSMLELEAGRCHTKDANDRFISMLSGEKELREAEKEVRKSITD